MLSEVRISNSAANVIKFIIIEILVALLIEPAVSEINRIRAQRLAVAGRRVRIRTSLLRRDFSGPAVGGKKGVLWKLFFLISLLAALLSSEFAFDYDVRAVPLGSTIPLTGLSNNVSQVEREDLLSGSLSEKLFSLVKCSSLKGNIRSETRLRPDGECYSGNSSGVSFPEPCALNPTDAHDYSCVRTDEGIVREKGFENFEDDDIYGAKATYVFMNNDDVEYQGRRGENGEHIRYCSEFKMNSAVTHVCMEYLEKSGDSIISGYDIPVVENPSSNLDDPSSNLDDPSANLASVAIFSSPVIRIGADTFKEPGCAGCGLRLRLMLNFVAGSLVVQQQFDDIRPSYDDYGRVVAMLAMGLPDEIGRAIDDQDVQEIGLLIIDWNLVLPLAIITIIAVVVRVPSFMLRKVVNVPLDYSSAMYAAYDREVGGGDCNSRRTKSSYDVGLVETCETKVLYLSLNAENTVPYNGEEIRGTNECCGSLTCKKCAGGVVGSQMDIESQSGAQGDSKEDVNNPSDV